MKWNPKKIQMVDQIWIAVKEIIPRTPANSVFNLKPAGTPINHTQPERNNSFVMSLANFRTHMQADSAWYSSAKPNKFPRSTSTAKLDHMECLCNAAFSAYSTLDSDLWNKEEDDEKICSLIMKEIRVQYQKRKNDDTTKEINIHKMKHNHDNCQLGSNIKQCRQGRKERDQVNANHGSQANPAYKSTDQKTLTLY